MTVGQRWRFRRNLVIIVAARAGLSQRIIADVFDLPRSRISAILKEYRAKYGTSELAVSHNNPSTEFSALGMLVGPKDVDADGEQGRMPMTSEALTAQLVPARARKPLTLVDGVTPTTQADRPSTGHPVRLSITGWPATIRAWTAREWSAEPHPRPAAMEHGNGLWTCLEMV